MRVPYFLSLLALMAAGCVNTGAVGGSDPVVGPTWQLALIGTTAPTGSEATITFADDGRVYGSTGCNRYFGQYDLAAGGALTLSQVGSTRMACPSGDMAQETQFLDALNRADRVEASGGRLALLAGGDRLLTFGATSGDTADATLTGTVTYLPRIALPPGAVLAVRLVDASMADAPSRAVAETRVGTDGGQVPLPFSLDYDASEIQPGNRYVVRAEIFDAAGVLLWTTDTAYPVLTNGAPRDDVEIRVVQVTEADTADAIVGRTWRLDEVRQPSGVVLATQGEAPFTITFGQDGRYNGRADCNRYGGSFEVGPDGTIRLSQGLSTLAACPDASVSSDFFDVLNDVQRYTLSGGRLTLTGASGGALVFE